MLATDLAHNTKVAIGALFDPAVSITESDVKVKSSPDAPFTRPQNCAAWFCDGTIWSKFKTILVHGTRRLSSRHLEATPKIRRYAGQIPQLRRKSSHDVSSCLSQWQMSSDHYCGCCEVQGFRGFVGRELPDGSQANAGKRSVISMPEAIYCLRGLCRLHFMPCIRPRRTTHRLSLSVLCFAVGISELPGSRTLISAATGRAGRRLTPVQRARITISRSGRISVEDTVQPCFGWVGNERRRTWTDRHAGQEVF